MLPSVNHDVLPDDKARQWAAQQCRHGRQVVSVGHNASRYFVVLSKMGGNHVFVRLQTKGAVQLDNRDIVIPQLVNERLAGERLQVVLLDLEGLLEALGLT